MRVFMQLYWPNAVFSIQDYFRPVCWSTISEQGTKQSFINLDSGSLHDSVILLKRNRSYRDADWSLPKWQLDIEWNRWYREFSFWVFFALVVIILARRQKAPGLALPPDWRWYRPHRVYGANTNSSSIDHYLIEKLCLLFFPLFLNERCCFSSERLCIAFARRQYRSCVCDIQLKLFCSQHQDM